MPSFVVYYSELLRSEFVDCFKVLLIDLVINAWLFLLIYMF